MVCALRYSARPFSFFFLPFFFSLTWERRRLNLHPGWRNKRQGHPSERKRCVGLSSSVVSLSPGSQLNTRLCSTIQAAPLRLGGSGLQTMSGTREQSFSTSATSNAARRSEKQTSHSRDAGKFAHECGHFPGQIESSSVNFNVLRCFSCQLPDVQMDRRNAFSLFTLICIRFEQFHVVSAGRRSLSAHSLPPECPEIS